MGIWGAKTVVSALVLCCSGASEDIAKITPAGARFGPPTTLEPASPAPALAGTTAGEPTPTTPFQLNLTPPEPGELFRFDNEEKLRQRFRTYLKNFPAIEFPPTHEAVPLDQPAPRLWSPLLATAEPAYVCYQRLWFEQRNSERYGWDFGILQPFLGAGVFYTDLALMPLHWLTDPCRWFDCSSGQCLPGDAVPLLWNPVISK